MPLGRAISKGLVYTIDLTKIADRANPRTVEAPIYSQIQEPTVIDWGDGSSEVVSSGTYPAHTYAEGTGDVFTVTLRSATGHLPLLSFNDGYSVAAANNPTYNIAKAVISCDHFGGWTGNTAQGSRVGMFNGCSNMTYCDTRITGLSKWTAFSQVFQLCTELNQPIESFCFSFCDASAAGTFTYTFSTCRKLYGTIPANMFDGLTGIKTFSACFNYCTSLEPPPYIFWKADGTLDTGKFPNLGTSGGANCYANCSTAMKAQVPEAYGGTMTVS